MENWIERIRLTECLMVASIVVAFLILAVFGQRKTWISTESIMAVISGLAFVIFPRQILTLETAGTLGQSELDLARFFGLVLACSGLIWYKTCETRDGTVPITLMMSRVFLSSTLLVCQLFVYYGSKSKAEPGSKLKQDKSTQKVEWSEQMFFMGIIPTVMWLLGNLLHLARSDDFNTYPQHNIRLNNHLRVDAWFLIVYGIALLAFPSQIVGAALKSKNMVALHIARSIGTLYIGDGIISLQSPGFLHERDKKTIFLTRIIAIVSQFALIGVLWYLDHAALTFICYMAIALLPQFINALIGYFAGGTTIYHVPTPKKTTAHDVDHGDSQKIE